MNAITLSYFDISFDGEHYKSKRLSSQLIRAGITSFRLRKKINRLFGYEEDDVPAICGYSSSVEDSDIVIDSKSEPKAERSVFTIDNNVNYCVSRRLYSARSETVWQVTKGNEVFVSNTANNADKVANMTLFTLVISRLFNAARSGIAGAVALGSAYAVSMPQKAEADMVYDISSQEDILGPYDANYRDVLYQSPQINFRDSNGNLIEGGLTNRVVLLYVGDHAPVYGTHIIGGLTLKSEQTQSNSGWFWSRDSPDYLGLQPGETATNGLNGGSYWIGLIDNGDIGYANNGTVGTYTLNDNGTWSISSEPGESMSYYGDIADFEGQYAFRLNGVPAHPESGTGPMTIESIDIFAPWQIVPEADIRLAATMPGQFPIVYLTNMLEGAVTVTVQRSEDLRTTNWLDITNLTLGVTNFTDTSVTGEWQTLFYRTRQ